MVFGRHAVVDYFRTESFVRDQSDLPSCVSLSPAPSQTCHSRDLLM
jgi:hypothetical protein